MMAARNKQQTGLKGAFFWLQELVYSAINKNVKVCLTGVRWTEDVHIIIIVRTEETI